LGGALSRCFDPFSAPQSPSITRTDPAEDLMADQPNRPPTPFRPPRPAKRAAKQDIEKPAFPPDARADLPRRVRTELRQAVKRAETAEELMLALSLGAEAIDADEPEAALPYLLWAKSVAQRSVAIREALGVAHYLAGDFKLALSELRAYRRMSASPDQNHLIADCLRAMGQPVSEVAEAIGEMLEATGVDPDRRVEGLLVWAGALADAGDLDAARAVIRRATRQLLDDAGPEARQRFQYVVGDLAFRTGDHGAARAVWAPLAELDDDPYDLEARLAELT
jgi:tetratricopeptide (TPR) repeat protein